MNKTFCDICKKEMKGDYKSVSFYNVKYRENPFKEYELCEDCYWKFCEYIDNIIKINKQKVR